MKVLIIDPDWRFARQATDFLESRAHLVVHHTWACDGLAHAASWRPDLVILATELAETDVLGPLGRLEPRPAVLLAGWPDRSDVAWRAWQRGGDELLMKPLFSSDELRSAIATACKSAAAAMRPVRRAVAASA